MFRRIFSFVIAVVVALSLFTIPAVANNTATTADALAILRRVASGDTSVTTADALAVLRAVARGESAPAIVSFAEEVLRLVNAERAKVGVSELKLDDLLGQAAQIRAVELKTRYEHSRPDGRDWDTVLAEVGVKNYRAWGENLAYGYNMLQTAEAVVQGWMSSPGHKENILKAEFTHLGVGMYRVGSEYFWVQLFTAYF